MKDFSWNLHVECVDYKHLYTYFNEKKSRPLPKNQEKHIFISVQRKPIQALHQPQMKVDPLFFKKNMPWWWNTAVNPLNYANFGRFPYIKHQILRVGEVMKFISPSTMGSEDPVLRLLGNEWKFGTRTWYPASAKEGRLTVGVNDGRTPISFIYIPVSIDRLYRCQMSYLPRRSTWSCSSVCPFTCIFLPLYQSFPGLCHHHMRAMWFMACLSCLRAHICSQ